VTGYKDFVHTDHPTIRYLMNKPDINGRMIKWFMLLQQFDLTILDKPDKHNVVAYFLSRLTIPTEEGTIDYQFPDENLFSISLQTPWFSYISNYLITGKFPQHLSYRERCKIVWKSPAYTWVADYLFKLCPYHILKRCIREYEVHYILHYFHDEPCGGHYAAKRKNYKILQAGYYRPTLHRDAHQYTSHCDECQRMEKPTKRNEIPLQPQVSFEPFDKWGMDFIGSIDPPSGHKKQILVCIDYMT
jgi:hypothetical protein